MSKLPSISARDAIRAFERVGYERDRQRGSHIVLRHRDAPHRRLVVPEHKSLAKGTLRALIREAGLTVDEFTALL
ncbi:MAG: type II toxin-antitoxin system HicA family toxin [Planctomycetes bacterium]|nr:type II toxin-antitoxin system HicA family toxin [Planctomycetota bacterium]